jgi:hypothetical protein
VTHGSTRLVRSALRSLRVAAVIWAVAAPAAIAHHGPAVKFDPGQPIRLDGRVAHVDWSNPHAHIVMLVQQGEATLAWYVELDSIVALERSGWQRDTLRPGDAITVEGLSARDGSRQVSGDSVVVSGTGQRVLQLSAAAVPPADDRGRAIRPAPRWPNGESRLGPEPGSSGYWVPVGAAMVERGADVAVHANGQLEDLGAIERVAPFQPWARSLYEYRQRRFLRDDPMFLQCKPPGGPRKFQVPYGIQFIEDRPHQRIFVVAGGGNRDWHLIYTDGRALDGGFGHDDGNFLYYGRNVGAWDGDSFVVRSTGFNESFWFANGGLPHTSQLSLTERLTRTDYDTLIYEVTIDDPGAYTRAWTSTWRLRWVADAEPPEYYCQDNRP